MSHLRRAIPLGYFQGKVPSSAYGNWQEMCGAYRGWYFFNSEYSLEADPVTCDWVNDRYLRPMLWTPSGDWGAFVLLGWVQLCGIMVPKVVGVVDTRVVSMDVYLAAGNRVREFQR
ncbi:unnamed protein product, partial [Ectocarpus sp. 8 AP-2014]